MIGSINFKGLLVTRDMVSMDCAPVKVIFQEPITDESMRSLAAFAYGIAQVEKETMQKLGLKPKEGYCGERIGRGGAEVQERGFRADLDAQGVSQ